MEVARTAAKAVPIAAADTAFNLFLLVARLPRFIPVDVFMVIMFSFYGVVIERGASRSTADAMQLASSASVVFSVYAILAGEGARRGTRVFTPWSCQEDDV